MFGSTEKEVLESAKENKDQLEGILNLEKFTSFSFQVTGFNKRINPKEQEQIREKFAEILSLSKKPINLRNPACQLVFIYEYEKQEHEKNYSRLHRVYVAIHVR